MCALMLGADCTTCKRRHRNCPTQEQYLSTCLLKRFAHGLPLPSCPEYQPDYHHGIDGVYRQPNPPAPPVRSKDCQC